MDSISKFGSALAPFVVDLGGQVNPGKERKKGKQITRNKH